MNSRKPELLNICLIFGILAIIPIVLLFPPFVMGGQKERGDTNYPERIKELARECAGEYQDVKWLRVSEFTSMSKKEEWTIVDARNVIERALSIIPGSISIDEIEKEMGIQKKKKILVYDTVGCRSGTYSQKLQSKGLRVFGLWGGALAWAWDGRTFVTPGGLPTKTLHVFQEKWNVLPSGYEGGW
jgi:rhodanese-related sulfurtransferase